MTAYSFQVQPQDRLIFFSDGVSQAGLGTPDFPLGWRNSGVREYVLKQVAEKPDISAQELSERILREAIAHEPGLRPKDDITAVCLYYREPHKMLLFTGRPSIRTVTRNVRGCSRRFRERKSSAAELRRRSSQENSTCR